MKKCFFLGFLFLSFLASSASGQPAPLDCYGGFDESTYWYLLSNSGFPLGDGNWVYGAWTGPDGEIDPPDSNGNPTDDDSLVVSGETVYATFFITLTTWADSSLGHPTPGELVYCRIFDGPEGTIGPGNYYADSQLHVVEYFLGEVFYCLFPGDPGGGHTDTPVVPGIWNDIVIHGGLDSTESSSWPLTDINGQQLEDGDLVQCIWTGPDGQVDALNELSGMPTGDDSLLTIWDIGFGYWDFDMGLFRKRLITHEAGSGVGRPAQGDRIYLRVFGDSNVGEGSDSRSYGESEIYEVRWEFGEILYTFPDSSIDANIEVPWYRTIEIYGGVDSAMTEYPLTDYTGAMLEDGNLVQLIWAGPGESVDAINEIDGMPSGDDSVLTTWDIGTGYGQNTGLFEIEFQTFSSQEVGMPADGDEIYLRVFNDPSTEVATYYGESYLHALIFQKDERFFSFSDDTDDAVNPLHQNIAIYGGMDSSMTAHPLTDSLGVVLTDGDLVQLIWAGLDGVVDAIDGSNGLPTGDDSLLTSFGIGTGYGDGTGLFKHELSTFSSHDWGLPADGDALYIRVFNDPMIKHATHYGESEVYLARHEHAELFFPFPDNISDCVIPNPGYTSVEWASVEWADDSGMQPAEFALLQNYPNPFNASTDIKYAIPVAAIVEINVYNIRGEKVVTLVDDHRVVGLYTIRWDAGTLASGIYFCRLQAGEYVETVKMVVLR